MLPKELDQAAVAQALATGLLKFDGAAYAVSSSALRNDTLPDTVMTHSVPRNFHSKRSGDIYLMFEPNRCAAPIRSLNRGFAWRLGVEADVDMGEAIGINQTSPSVAAPPRSSCLCTYSDVIAASSAA